MAIYVSGVYIFIAILAVFFFLKIRAKQYLKNHDESREHTGILAEDRIREAPRLESQWQIAHKIYGIRYNINNKTLEGGLTKDKLEKQNNTLDTAQHALKSSYFNKYLLRCYKSLPASNNIYTGHGYQEIPVRRPSFKNTLFLSRVQNLDKEYDIFSKKSVSLVNCIQRKQDLNDSLKGGNIKIGFEFNSNGREYLPKFSNSKTADQYCQMISALKEGLPGKINEIDENLNELVAPLPKRATRSEILKSNDLTPIMAKIKSSRLEKLPFSELKRMNGKRSNLEICILKKAMFR
ncbi:hypothetical protein BB560_003995 [Smittium megazygosporum]|uniref:Uncharacterized protein n=1 Tax=Smittium megazygosporum TaxID=133381 RepID=A0A2T9ZAH0_9FUNG|nr:hypothetical protein BB560_003995 [Smittium megazygosporum]